MVKSYDDPMKKKARQELRTFISQNLRVSPSEARVVCFPGAEYDGEEALEIKEVYDLLGISRENITGLEYNPENAERLRKADLGIKVEEEDAYDFFRTTDKVFDIVSLDYTGQRGWRERDITRFIGGRQLLDRWGIFSTNHLVKRESELMKMRFLEQLVFTRDEDWMKALPNGATVKEREEYIQEVNGRYASLVARLKGGEANLDRLRDAITQDNIQIFSGGINEVNPMHNLFHNINVYSIDGLDHLPTLEELNLIPKAQGLEADPNYWSERSKPFHAEGKVIELLHKKGISKKASFWMLRLLAMDYQKGFNLRNLERRTYNSNKNAKMLLDMVSFKPVPYSLIQRAKDVVYVDGDSKIMLNSKRLPRAKFKRLAEKTGAAILDELSSVFPDPTYLGSSWKPPKRKERITKEQAIELLRAGCSAKEIAECYSGFSKMQIAAFSAHLTMGTYTGGGRK